MIPGVEISLFLIIFLSLAAGVISGFVGVGGGFIMTPALIILGFPAQFAVGTSLIWIMGNSIIGTLRHRQLGNVDMKLGILMMVFTTGGVEMGVRVLNWTRDPRHRGLNNKVKTPKRVLHEHQPRPTLYDKQ